MGYIKKSIAGLVIGLSLVGVFVKPNLSAGAEWKRVSTSEKNTDYYVDEASLRRSGNQYYAWILKDLSKPVHIESAGKDYRSSTGFWVIDCKRRKTKILEMFFFDARMGKGEMVSSFRDPEHSVRFNNVRPDTSTEHIFEFVCMSGADGGKEQKPARMQASDT